jgi:transposase
MAITRRDCPTGIAQLFMQLHCEIAALRSQLLAQHNRIQQLERDNGELRQQAGYWKSQHAAARERLGKLTKENQQLQGELRQLRAECFGRSSEKQAATDRSNQLDDPSEPKPARRRGQQPGQPGPKRRNYDHLPQREQVAELPHDQQQCAHCGKPLARCGSEDSEQLEVEVQFYRLVSKRVRYQRTCSCPGPRTLTAPAVPKLIPKGRLGTSLWVEILVDKFTSHRPTERLLDQWHMHGLDLAPATVNEGLQHLEPLFQPIYEALRERNRLGLLMHGDETRWFVFADTAGKVGHCWWLWGFQSTDTVVYVLDPSRSHEVPERHFPDNAAGILLVDRYSGYKAMAQVKNGTLLLAFCWAHVRRDFVRVGKGFAELKDWALDWLKRIRELYRLNRERLQKPGDALAAANVRQHIAAMQEQYRRELAEPNLRLPCQKALTSLQEHWTGLTRFVDDPRIPLDNNAMERRFRGPALGRKNYYGSGSLWSGRLAAMLFSILATLSMWGINPRLWLKWYLDSCATAGGRAPADIVPFLPWNLTPEQLVKLRKKPPGGNDSS